MQPSIEIAQDIAMDPRITVDAGIPEADARRHVAFYANPGDVVRPRALTADTLLQDTVREAGVGTLTVTSLRIGEVSLHEYAEIPGTWRAGLVKDSRDHVHEYGVLFPHDGAYHFVQLDDRTSLPVGEPRRLDGTLNRWARHQVGESLDKIVGAGASGEFILAETADGFELVGVPWHSDASEAELRVAGEVVEAAAAAPKP
jgi:hypothetical protein